MKLIMRFWFCCVMLIVELVVDKLIIMWLVRFLLWWKLMLCMVGCLVFVVGVGVEKVGIEIVVVIGVVFSVSMYWLLCILDLYCVWCDKLSMMWV